jgi:hypothetical protein
MKWNQKTIHQWGIDTFGNAALNTLGVAIRMSKEAIELSNVLMKLDDVEKISMESADVAIVLVQVANCIGFDVHAEDQAVEEVDSAIDTEIDAAMILNAAAIDLLSAIFHGAERTQVVLQIRKIMTCLGALEEIYEFDLVEKIQVKMEINAARQWAQGKDGSFQHV